MWRFGVAIAAMIAITLALFNISKTPDPVRYTPAQQEAIWAAERARAPFELRLQRADGTKSLLAYGGGNYVVIAPERIEDFGLAVGGDAAVYAPRPADPDPHWHVGIEARTVKDAGFAQGEAVPWPGGDLRRMAPADAAPMHGHGPLEKGELLAYAPAERLLVSCLSFGSCRLIFQAGRFQIRMVFHERDRAIIRTIAAVLRRCLPQWDGRIVDIVAPTPGCS